MEQQMSRIFDILVSKFGSDLISLADANYLEEPRGRYKSNPMPVIKPRTTKQVSEIIYFCNQNNIGVRFEKKNHFNLDCQFVMP